MRRSDTAVSSTAAVVGQVDLTPDTDLPGIRDNVQGDRSDGVEMEALTAASVAALTLYDMCKAIDRGMTIEKTQVMNKSGGASGEWRREHSN